jgi:hypothetical protein
MLAPQTRIILVRSTQLITGALLITAALGLYTNFYVLNTGIAIGFAILALLAYLMGYPWISAGAAIIAVIYSPQIPLHLPRHIWVTLDLIALGSMVYFTYWATNPYQKGTRFEQYVAALFPEPDFIIQDRTRDISKFLNRRVESDMHPDFLFRNQKTGKSFAVECKWRGRWAQGNSGEPGLWWNLAQGARYSAYEKQAGIPVFVALGIGGSPEKPKEVYFMEPSRLQYPFLKQSYVRVGKSASDIIR